MIPGKLFVKIITASANLIVMLAHVLPAVAQWSRLTSLPDAWVNDMLETDSAVYIAVNGSGAGKSTDSGATWTFSNNGLNFYPANRLMQVIVYDNKLLVATGDGVYMLQGDSWIRKSNGLIVGGGAQYVFAESIFNTGKMLITGCHTGIYSSADGAESWTLSYSSGTHVYAKNFTYHEGKLYGARESINTPVGFVSGDSGATWANLTGLTFPTITFYSEPGMLWSGTIHGAWLTTNNGANWEQRINGLSPDPYNSSFLRVNNFMITSLEAGGSGMFRSSDNGLTWLSYDEGLPFLLSINELMRVGDYVWAATSEGIYRRHISDLTAVGSVANNIPESARLEQNFPNPFNPSTVISYYIPPRMTAGGAVRVVISIYDLSGKKLLIPVDEMQTHGRYEIILRSDDIQSGGVYFYALSVDGKLIESRKMILLK